MELAAKVSINSSGLEGVQLPERFPEVWNSNVSINSSGLEGVQREIPDLVLAQYGVSINSSGLEGVQQYGDRFTIRVPAQFPLIQVDWRECNPK